jgi:hypothetical protein
MALDAAIAGDEVIKIALGDPHGGAEVMRDKFFLLDPPADRAGGYTKAPRYFRNREKLGSIASAVAAMDVTSGSC